MAEHLITRTSVAVAALLAGATLAACGTSDGSAPATVTRTVSDGGDTAPPSSAAPASSATDAVTSSPAAPAAAPDACSLLTRAEAEKVAATPLRAPQGAGNAAGAAAVQCLFTGPTTGPTAQVEVYVGDGAKQQLVIDRDNLGHRFSTVPGVGDECLQEENFIFVRKGTVWASLRLVRLNDAADNVRPLQTGIKQIAARLP